MFSKLVIALHDDEQEALIAMAQSEVRGVQEQARFIIRDVLQQQGFLKFVPEKPDNLLSPSIHKEVDNKKRE